MIGTNITGVYTPANNGTLPECICAKKFTVSVDKDENYQHIVKLTEIGKGDNFILITQVLYIIQTDEELLVTNPKGTMVFQNCQLQANKQTNPQKLS